MASQSALITNHSISAAGDDQGISLLSFDGGGVRGLSSLYVLDQLMNSVNENGKNDPPLKPCEYFDMIGGTSTGGIIAIMLGRLRMDVQDCIDAYIRLADKVFTKEHHRVNWKGNIQGRFDHTTLETVIKDVIKAAGYQPDALLKDQSSNACKVFVCALSDRLNTLVTFTSYKGPRVDRELLNQATILQACRATSAASSFFDPLTMRIGKLGADYEDKFIDGALGYNNPIRQLWTEASDVWDGPIEGKIACVVSIGTGKPALVGFGPGALDMGKRLLAVSTETEKTAGEFYNDHRHGLVKSQRYYRFNVGHGLEKIGLEEAKEKLVIIRATKEYLKDGEVFDKMEKCSEKLSARECLHGMLRFSSFLAELASKHLANFRLRYSNTQTKFDLRWFTHTIPYHQWSVHEKRPGSFIWYPTKDHLDLGAMVAANEATFDILYFDCSGDTATISSSGTVSSSSRKIMSNTAAVITWSLFSQALCNRCPSVAELGGCLLDIIRGHPQLFVDSSERWEVSLQALEGLFDTEVNVNTDCQIIVILDHVDAIERNQLKDLRSFMRQSRCLFIGMSNSETRLELQGIPSVDEDTEYHEFLETLRFEKMGLRRDAIATAETGTNHWIWSNHAFLEWNEASSGLLWIQGKPGSGKSVLAKTIQNHLLMATGSKCASIPSQIVGSWYYSRRHQLDSNTLMIRSLLLQILEQERSLFSQIQLRQTRFPFYPRLTLEPDTLMEVLLDLKVSGEGSVPVCCIIDGLDEERIEPGFNFTIGPFINELLRQPSRFKIIALGRPLAGHAFQRKHHIILEGVNSPDVEKIIDAGLTRLIRALECDDSSDEDSDVFPVQSEAFATLKDKQPAAKDRRSGLKSLGRPFQSVKNEEKKRLEEIRKYLSQNARGVILWVMTVLKELENRAREPLCTIKTIESELYRLPHELSKLYKKIAKDLQDNLSNSPDALVKARRALVWVSVATSIRPFQLQELLDALAISTGGKASMKVHSWNSFNRQLQRLCGPFIEIIRPAGWIGDNASRNKIRKTDEVQLLHQTVKVFLEDPDAAGPFFVQFGEAQKMVEKESLEYLKYSLPNSPTEYAPLPVRPGSAWKDNVEVIGSYLEELSLLPFVMTTYKHFRSEVPEAYQSVFANVISTSLADEEFYQKYMMSWGHLSARMSIQRGQTTKVERYFFLYSCINGWVNAVENLLLLSSLRFTNDVAIGAIGLWRDDEDVILHAALIAASQYYFLPEIESLASYMMYWNLDPHYQSSIPTEAFSAEELALMFYDSSEPAASKLKEYDQLREQSMLAKAVDRAGESIPEIRTAVQAVLAFWGAALPDRFPSRRKGPFKDGVHHSPVPLYKARIQPFQRSSGGAQ